MRFKWNFFGLMTDSCIMYDRWNKFLAPEFRLTSIPETQSTHVQFAREPSLHHRTSSANGIVSLMWRGIHSNCVTGSYPTTATLISPSGRGGRQQQNKQRRDKRSKRFFIMSAEAAATASRYHLSPLFIYILTSRDHIGRSLLLILWSVGTPVVGGKASFRR